ncbi:hypothetical protein P7F88_10490 [Vibrio hannami]|uniref:hypothetical protein n=1 Tax=Vibrio hannami TaxID=2717094 RepID=UPI00240F75D5|nr:hypothetical protein [Vibrio hannami]MDG3086517.1 hypothetical protein [Vibrio hannami]
MALQKRDSELARTAMIAHLEHSKAELTKLVDFKDSDILTMDDFFFLEFESEG